MLLFFFLLRRPNLARSNRLEVNRRQARLNPCPEESLNGMNDEDPLNRKLIHERILSTGLSFDAKLLFDNECSLRTFSYSSYSSTGQSLALQLVGDFNASPKTRPTAPANMKEATSSIYVTLFCWRYSKILLATDRWQLNASLYQRMRVCKQARFNFLVFVTHFMDLCVGSGRGGR